jgi:hypothetical protein
VFCFSPIPSEGVDEVREVEEDGRETKTGRAREGR